MRWPEFQRWAGITFGAKVYPPSPSQTMGGSQGLAKVLGLTEIIGTGRSREYTLRHQRRFAVYWRMKQVLGWQGGQPYPRWMPTILDWIEDCESGYLIVTPETDGISIGLSKVLDGLGLDRAGSGLLIIPLGVPDNTET